MLTLSPAMQQAEALRTLIIGSREVAEELVMQRATKHNFNVTAEYLDNAKEQAGALIAGAQQVQREPATWPELRPQLLERVRQVETDPNAARNSLAHLAQLKMAGAELDRNRALTPAFREPEVPADQLARLGKPVEELWRRGQMEKLLRGERTDQLPFPMPGPAGGPQHVPMQLKLDRDATGTVAVQVYLPAAVREAITRGAAPHAGQDPPPPAPPTLKADPPSPPKRSRGPRL